MRERGPAEMGVLSTTVSLHAPRPQSLSGNPGRRAECRGPRTPAASMGLVWALLLPGMGVLRWGCEGSGQGGVAGCSLA